MNLNQLPEAVQAAKADYDDILLSTKRVKNTEAEASLITMSEQLREAMVSDPSSTNPETSQFAALPAYAALAFRKQFIFPKGSKKTIFKAAANPEIDAEEAFSQTKSLGIKIHPNAIAAWKILREKDPATAWNGMLLNAIGDPEEQKFVDPNQPQPEPIDHDHNEEDDYA